MAHHAVTITESFDMSKTFDTINIHTLIRKLLQTNIPGTIIKFIANYIKGRKAYTTYINHSSKQRNLKLAFHPQYLTFTPQTYHHPVHRSDHGLRRRHHDHTHTHTHTSVAKKYIQDYSISNYYTILRQSLRQY